MSILVIGAGIAGLTAAWDLVSHGTPGSDITVLEASPQVGGKLARAEVAGHLVDIGAESMLALRPEARQLIEEVGLSDALTAPATTSASIWSRDRLWPLPTGTLMGVPGDPESVRGVLTDAEVERLSEEQPWPEPLTADVAVGEYVAQRLGDAVVDRLVEPLLGGVYAASARRLSMAAAVPMLYAVARDGGSVTGAAARAAAARSGTRSGASAFIGLTGGVGCLPEHLREVLRERGVTIETGVTVRELTSTGSQGRPQWEVTCGPASSSSRHPRPPTPTAGAGAARGGGPPPRPPPKRRGG
ncbi:MAG: protoporphyrinogen oxidase, partial [Actinomycetia bacterium]|nr:protoporphyrinogen oxidase [Actinomycetes bacterium]